MFKSYFLSSSALTAPRTEGDQTSNDERIDVDLEDDETVQDPQGESDTGDDVEAEGDDDEGADDDEEGDADVEAGGEPRRQESRGNRQMGALRAETRRLAEENARITRQLDEIRRSPPQPQQPTETPAQRAERMALLTPEERIQETVADALRSHDQRSTALTNQLLDQSDKASFAARAAVNPVLRRLEPEIERRLQDLRGTGQNLPRHIVATFLIGEKALAQLEAKQAKGNRQERRRTQGGRPVQARSDVAGDRRERNRGGATTAEQMEARFGDVQI